MSRDMGSKLTVSATKHSYTLIRLVCTSLRSVPALGFLCAYTKGLVPRSSPHDKFRPLLYNTYMSSRIVCSNDSVF